MKIVFKDFDFEGERVDEIALKLPNVIAIEELAENKDKFFDTILDDLGSMRKEGDI